MGKIALLDPEMWKLSTSAAQLETISLSEADGKLFHQIDAAEHGGKPLPVAYEVDEVNEVEFV